MNEMEKLEEKIKNGETFMFKGKAVWFLWLFTIFCTIMGLVVLFTPIGPFGFLFILVGIGFGFFAFKQSSAKMIITPEGIVWKRSSPGKINFKDVTNIEYYNVQFQQGLATVAKDVEARFILKNGRTIKKRVKRWTTPGYMESDIYIRKIIEYYYLVANPDKLIDLFKK